MRLGRPRDPLGYAPFATDPTLVRLVLELRCLRVAVPAAESRPLTTAADLIEAQAAAIDAYRQREGGPRRWFRG